MFFELNQLFSTKLPHRFKCGLVNALDPDGSGRGEGGRSDGASGGNGSGGASGSGGLSGGGGGGLGGYSGSGGMSPDARDDPSRKGIDGMGQGFAGNTNGYKGSWEHAIADKEKGFFGYPGSGGFTVGAQGYNDGQISIGDISGLGIGDKLGVGFQVAKDNPGKAIGGALGMLTGGLPGLSIGYGLGTLADKALSGYSMKAMSKATMNAMPGLATSAATSFGTPALSMAASIASTALDPNTKASSHIAGVVGAGLGGKLAGKYGAGAMADLGQTLGNLAPAGEMNPRNSDLSSADSVSTGIGTSMGGDGSSAIPSMALNSNLSKVSNMQSLQNAKQWDDYQSRYHNG